MPSWFREMSRAFFLFLVFLPIPSLYSAPLPSLSGVLRDAGGNPVGKATVKLIAADSKQEYSATTSASGQFSLPGIAAGSSTLTVNTGNRIWTAVDPVITKEDATLTAEVRLPAEGQVLRMTLTQNTASPQASGGEHLSTGEVSSLPLNERDFSKFLLLAAGTMTDTNGAANFTQQFAVNGQRGSAAVFAIHGADPTDPELGGATFSNFNVDAIQEVQSSSGVMPADTGHGAAGFTNVITKSGSDQVHGSVFEFVRNASFDARNFFDHKSDLDTRRLPPFARNEFGVTNGGPLFVPHIYDGRGKTFYFAEYQGFRQVLGTTQVFPVPTLAERQGIDTTTFPGDTLTVPVNSKVAALLAGYPLPNDSQGAFGARTYSTSSKVATRTDQASLRIDHHISEKAILFLRASRNQVTGPTTNPDQTALNPDFGVKFLDHQRSAAIKYSRAATPRFSYQTTIGYIRSTPLFLTSNQTQPAIAFGDGLFQGFNSADGSVFGSYGNVYQFKQDMVYTAISFDARFHNGYIATQTLGIDHEIGSGKLSASYVGTAGVHLASVLSPNGYGGAEPAFAPYTQFNSAGQAIGGFGPESVMSSGAHSSYHALQTSVSQNNSRAGLSFQASYTFSKSIDDTSAVPGGISGSSGVILQTLPQDPRNPSADKGPSTFDVTHVFTLSLIQSLPLERVGFLQPLGKKLTKGWQVLNITTLTSGPPFTVYSGVQQTGAGLGGTDRPDLLAMPIFSTSRAVREDYFGLGKANSSLFSIPINVPGGTGPFHGRFGILGRDTFRGPGFRDFDLALIKDTAFGHRGNGEFAVLQFRAELFNIFNEVNFGLPSNIVLGSGFGVISRTAGPSRQIQFSLKLNY